MTDSGYRLKAVAGETFDGIARDLFGSEQYAAELMSFNPEYCNRMRFEGGEELKIPYVYVPGDTRYASAEAPWK